MVTYSKVSPVLHEMRWVCINICSVLGKYDVICKVKETERKSNRQENKNKVKSNILFLLVILNLFIYFNSLI